MLTTITTSPLLTVTVLLMALSLAVLLAASFMYVYFPVSSRRYASLAETTCYHLCRPGKQGAIGPATCRRGSWAVRGHRPWSRSPAGYVFTRSPGRVALLNSTNMRARSGPVEVHVLPPGALAGVDRRHMLYRPWDGALALLVEHEGPVLVEQYPTVAEWQQALAAQV